jgi:hypothetical protein
MASITWLRSPRAAVTVLLKNRKAFSMGQTHRKKEFEETQYGYYIIK